jgi:hypothetical protein
MAYLVAVLEHHIRRIACVFARDRLVVTGQSLINVCDELVPAQCRIAVRVRQFEDLFVVVLAFKLGAYTS